MRVMGANQIKFSDVLMSSPALVSNEAGGTNTNEGQRFVILTSNLLCCYKEYGIGPNPTDVVEVKKIVNIQCSIGILTLTV
jgi:hypothetical protein